MSSTIGSVIFHQQKNGGNQILRFVLTTQRRKSSERGKSIHLTYSDNPSLWSVYMVRGRQMTFPSYLAQNHPGEWRARESFDKIWKITSVFLSISGWIYQASCILHFLLKTVSEYPEWTWSLWVLEAPRGLCCWRRPCLQSRVESSEMFVSSLKTMTLHACIDCFLALWPWT